MGGVSWVMVAGLLLAGSVVRAADESVVGAGTDAPVVAPGQPDELGRDRSGMRVDAQGGGVPNAFGDAMATTGSPDAVIRDGTIQLPDGVNGVGPLGSGGYEPGQASWSGFVFPEFQWTRFDGGADASTFKLHEIEVAGDFGRGETARVHLALNLVLDDVGRTFSTAGIDRLLVERLVEQAWVEWRAGRMTLRAGKEVSTLGAEDIDVTERVELTRSRVSVLAVPTFWTGARASFAVVDGVRLYAGVVNGAERDLDNNRSKSVVAGVPHQFGRPGAVGSLEGSLDAIVGAERLDTNDLRWVVSYWNSVVLPRGFDAGVEAVLGQEQGLGIGRRSGLANPKRAATWYAGTGRVAWSGEGRAAGVLEPLTLGWRLEYLRDLDLHLGLPTAGGLPAVTTLVGNSLTARYRLAPGVEAGLEYRADCERGDVRNVSVHSDVDAFPKLWNVARWLVTQQVTAGLLGRF